MFPTPTDADAWCYDRAGSQTRRRYATPARVTPFDRQTRRGTVIRLLRCLACCTGSFGNGVDHVHQQKAPIRVGGGVPSPLLHAP